LKIDSKIIIDAVNSSITMKEASIKCGLHFNTFVRYAKKLNVYKPNPGGKGTSKPKKIKILLSDILLGLHPTYQTFKLKKRLYDAKIKFNICEICGISDWNDKPLECELDHIDGNSSNHKLENLRILCPNCHSQTITFRAKNIKKH
jgi:hypothetical protein